MISTLTSGSKRSMEEGVQGLKDYVRRGSNRPGWWSVGE